MALDPLVVDVGWAMPSPLEEVVAATEEAAAAESVVDVAVAVFDVVVITKSTGCAADSWRFEMVNCFEGPFNVIAGIMFVELGKESAVRTGIPAPMLRSSVVSTVEVAVVVIVAPLIKVVNWPLLEDIKLVTPLLFVTSDAVLDDAAGDSVEDA